MCKDMRTTLHFEKSSKNDKNVWQKKKKMACSNCIPTNISVGFFLPDTGQLGFREKTHNHLILYNFM